MLRAFTRKERRQTTVVSAFWSLLDESILDWKPTGAEPKMTDASVQSRVAATLGKKSIVVPPALEEKMKNDSTLAKQIMAKVENFIATKETTKRPNRICSYVIVLDEDGEIARTCLTSGGGISGSSEAEIRQFEAEQAAKRKRSEEYARLNEESALKRKLQEQEEAEGYYKKQQGIKPVYVYLLLLSYHNYIGRRKRYKAF